MKILVSGGWSYGNIGDEAIAAATIQLVARYFPGCPVTYTAYDPQDFARNHGIAAQPSLHSVLGPLNGDKAALEKLLRCPGDPRLQSFNRLVDADTVLIMSGGGYFHEHWTSQFYARLLEIRLAKRAGAKVALVGQSIGPVYSDAGRRLLEKALNMCDYISVRDTSTQALLGQLKLQIPVHVSPDVALITRDIFPACPKQALPVVNVMPAAFSSYVPNTQRRAPNKWVQKLKKRLSPAGIRYARQFKKLVKALALSPDCKLQFVLSTTWRWDREFVDSLVKGIPADSYIIHSCETFDALCTQLSAGDAIISTKMHPLIVSASYGSIPLGISYNYKVDDFMALIGCTDQCFANHRLSANRILQTLREKWGAPPDVTDRMAQVYAGFASLAHTVGGDHE